MSKFEKWDENCSLESLQNIADACVHCGKCRENRRVADRGAENRAPFFVMRMGERRSGTACRMEWGEKQRRMDGVPACCGL